MVANVTVRTFRQKKNKSFGDKCERTLNKTTSLVPKFVLIKNRQKMANKP